MRKCDHSHYNKYVNRTQKIVFMFIIFKVKFLNLIMRLSLTMYLKIFNSEFEAFWPPYTHRDYL